jgi:hypothetical protein
MDLVRRRGKQRNPTEHELGPRGPDIERARRL